MSHSKTALGTCLCKSVSVSFIFAEEVFDACHCSMCRKWSGGPALTVFGGGQVSFKGEEFISKYSSSAWAERGFCKSCGTHLFYRLKESGFYNFPLGIIQDNENLKFHLQIFVDNKPENYSFANKTAMMTEAEVIAKYASNSDSPTTIENVSDTSFWVAHYRAKETERSDSLFKDPLAKILVGERGLKIAASMPKISRYTEWSVISRTVIIDRFIDDLIKQGVDTIINLGAGLDTRPYRMKLPASLDWIEVDYSNIIAHKNNILKAEKPQCRLTRIELDLANRDKRQDFFNQVAAKSKKVLIITEGVIPYLSPEQVIELGKDLLVYSQFKYWITEYFHPRVYPHLKNTVRAAKMRNAPFLFYPEDWFEFFEKIGWVKKYISFTGQIAQEFKRTPPMPWYAQLILPLLPKKVREQAGRMVGYVVFSPRA